MNEVSFFVVDLAPLALAQKSSASIMVSKPHCYKMQVAQTKEQGKRRTSACRLSTFGCHRLPLDCTICQSSSLKHHNIQLCYNAGRDFEGEGESSIDNWHKGPW